MGIIMAVLLGFYQYFGYSGESFFPWGGILLIIGVIGGFIILIGGILFLIGSNEFGKKHQKFVLYAVFIYIFGSIFGMMIGMGVSSLIYSDYLPTSSIVRAIVTGLTYIFALYHLENKMGRNILYAAFVISIIIGIITLSLNMFNIGDLNGHYPPFNSSPSNIYGNPLLGVISSVLLFIAVYIPYKRIKDGELIPQSPNV